MSAPKHLVLCLLAVAACAPVRAWDINYTATVNSQSPRWALPSEDLTYVHGGGRNNVRYAVTDFIAPFSGVFQFLSVALNGWDQYLVLYRGTFDPNSPLANAVAANDNYPTIGTSGFIAGLSGGERYYVVTSAAFNSSSGQAGFSASNSVAAVPEPGTNALLALGLAALVWTKRQAVSTRRLPKWKQSV